MSRPVIWFRSFNAFLGQAVSIWSIGFLIAPWVLSLIIAGFFASPLIVPLSIVCAIVGAVALVWGGFYGYWRYLHLTKETDEVLNRTEEDSEEGTRTTSSEEESVKDSTLRQPAINEIIPRVSEAIRDQAKKLTQEQENIRTWERINAFLSDAPTAFIFSSIIIFLVSHVFFGALIPAALLIAVVVSIAYGGLSAFVKDAQVNSKLQTMQMFKQDSEALKAKSDAFIAKAQTYIAKANKLIEEATKHNQQALVSEVIPTIETVTVQIKKLELSQKNLPKVYNEAHPEFTDKEKFRVIYSLFYGGIVAGSFLYIALPLVIGALGLAPLSFPVLLGIVIGVACVYGVYHAWHKVKVIQHEKWAAMDDKKIQEVSNSFTAIDQDVLTESVLQIEAIEKEFSVIKENINSQLQDEPVPFNYKDYVQKVGDEVQKNFDQIKTGTQNIMQQVTERYHEFEEKVVEKKDEVVKEAKKHYTDFFPIEPEYIELQNFPDDKDKTDNSLVEQQSI